MKKTAISVLVLVLALSMLLGGCGKTGQEQDNQAAATRTVIDAVGNSVDVPADISHIAVTPIPWSSVVSAIDGGSQRLVSVNPGAIKAYTGSFFEKLDQNYGTLDTTRIGSDFSMNIEELMNAGVQAAIIWDYQTGEAEQLKEVGIVPVMIKNENLEDLQKSFRAVGQLLGKEEKAQRFIEDYTTAYEQMNTYKSQVEKANKPRVLYLKRSDLTLQGNDNFIKEALELAGADNVAADAKSITMEEVLALDPEIIFLSDFDPFVPRDLYENRIEGQDWSGVSAVVNKQVYKTPVGIYRWDAPGVETPLMMVWLGKMIQPEIFADIDLHAQMEAFYKNSFSYELTEDDFAQIFNQDENTFSKQRMK